MRQSELFTKTKKEAPRDEESRNAQLLIRAGFVYKEMAGVYDFLPLGLRVLNKIINIIREEIDNIGGQEVFLSALQKPETWKKTDRWDEKKVDNWFKSRLINNSELGLAFTHEDPITAMMTQYINSYKDLPQYVYQFQNKFRNELRAKAGLLRMREFIMKDLYSFNTSEEQQDIFYQEAKKAYLKIYDRIGLGSKTFFTFASGGLFSKFSHEYQTVCENGEDIIYLDEDKGIAVNKEVYTDEVLAELGLDKKKLKEVKAIEVGNIFKLGTRFSEPLGLKYVDEDGKEKPVIMGSYGIGPGRIMATVIELFNDENGIIWPEAIAPFRVHLLQVGMDEEVSKKAQILYDKLLKLGIEILFDDRDVSAGQKFADSDLIGLPYRLIVSKKNGDQIEIKARNQAQTEILSVDEIIKKLK